MPSYLKKRQKKKGVNAKLPDEKKKNVKLDYCGGVWVAMWHCDGTRAEVGRKHFLRQCRGKNKKKRGDQKVPGL